MTHTARRRAELGTTMPEPGMVGFSRIGGLLGKLIAAGQAFAGDGSRWTHVYVVVDNDEVVEAMPGGARATALATRLADPEIAFSDELVQLRIELARERLAGPAEDLTDPDAYWAYVEHWIRRDFIERARALEGTHYGYLQYLYMGLFAVGIEWKWLRKRISERGSMICSQLVDEVARRGGVQLFDDGRLPQDVTPGDLAIRLGVA